MVHSLKSSRKTFLEMSRRVADKADRGKAENNGGNKKKSDVKAEDESLKEGFKQLWKDAEDFCFKFAKDLPERGTSQTLVPFCVYSALCLSVLCLYDTCNVPHHKRQDCGYPGISTTECYLYGRWQSQKDGIKIIARNMVGWCIIGFSCWVVSGYPPQGLLFYVLLAMVVTFQLTSCCHDNRVAPNVPHCYC